MTFVVRVSASVFCLKEAHRSSTLAFLLSSSSSSPSTPTPPLWSESSDFSSCPLPPSKWMPPRLLLGKQSYHTLNLWMYICPGTSLSWGGAGARTIHSTHTLTRVWRCIAYTIYGYEHQRSSKLKTRDPISEFTHSNYPAFLCIEETTGAVGVQGDTTMRGSSPQLLCSLSVGQICTWTQEEVFGQHKVMLVNLKTQPFLDGVLQVPVPQALHSFHHYITITTTSTLTQHYPFRHKLPIWSRTFSCAINDLQTRPTR